MQVYEKQPLNEFAKKNLLEFGRYTNENRAVPDYRDGLKPVHRRILWAAYNLGLRSNSGFKKSARVVGDAMGKYHPHGDVAIYDAMVTIANSNVKLIDGSGNWGTILGDPAAASRYTEARITKYAEKYLFDPRYLAVTSMIPNYDGTEKEPLILPSLLPTLLLIGTSGIGYGTTTDIPTFTLDSVVEIVKLGLKRELKPNDLMKTLVPCYQTSPVIKVLEPLNFYKTGSGSITYSPRIKVGKGEICIVGIPPYFSVEKAQEKLLVLEGVATVTDNSGAEPNIRIILKRGANEKMVAKKVAERLSTTRSYKTNITIRKIDRSSGVPESVAKFASTNLTTLLNNWVKYRVNLELRMLQHQLEQQQQQLAYQELLKFACTKLDIIFKVLKKKSNTLDEDLAKALKISLDDAKTILGLQVRRLSRMSEEEIANTIKKIKESIIKTKKEISNPKVSILNSLKHVNLE